MSEAKERTRRTPVKVVPERYDPLETCPSKIRSRYERTAAKARLGHASAILKLKCLECVCWEFNEVRKCEIHGCALWAKNRKDLCEEAAAAKGEG